MDSSAEPAGSVLAYARTLTGQLITVSGGLLQAAYLHGSAALGGWMPGRSDVDMLFVTADGIGSGVAERMCQVLCEAAGQCPGGLEAAWSPWRRPGSPRRPGRLCCMSRPVLGSLTGRFSQAASHPEILTC